MARSPWRLVNQIGGHLFDDCHLLTALEHDGKTELARKLRPWWMGAKHFPTAFWRSMAAHLQRGKCPSVLPGLRDRA